MSRRTSLLLVLLAGVAGASTGVAMTLLSSQERSEASSRSVESVNVAPGASPLAGGYEPDDVTVANCRRRTAQRVLCLGQAFGNLAYASGPSRAFAALRREVARTPELALDTHVIGHVIGSATVLRAGGDVGQALARGQEYGAGGYYHGVLLGVFHRADPSSVPELARSICTTSSLARSTYLRQKCAHAVGHGLMIHSGYDLPEALEQCDVQADADRRACHIGVFMENYSSFIVPGGVRTTWLRDDDLLYPCNAVGTDHRPACYVQVVNRIGPAVNWNWNRIAAHCARAREYRTQCLDSMGSWAWARSDRSFVALARACAPAKPAAACELGAARSLANIDRTGRTAVAWCRAAAAAPIDRCLREVGVLLALRVGTGAPLVRACRAAGAAAQLDSCIRR